MFFAAVATVVLVVVIGAIVHGAGTASRTPNRTQAYRLHYPYPYRLDTACVPWKVQFAGAYWDVADPAWLSPNPTPAHQLTGPTVPGHMELLSPSRAVFRFRAPEPPLVRTIPFRRHSGNLPSEACD